MQLNTVKWAFNFVNNFHYAEQIETSLGHFSAPRPGTQFIQLVFQQFTIESQVQLLSLFDENVENGLETFNREKKRSVKFSGTETKRSKVFFPEIQDPRFVCFSPLVRLRFVLQLIASRARLLHAKPSLLIKR